MNDRRWGRVGLLSLMAWLAIAGLGPPARGQPVLRQFDSIEWMVLDSSVIVRGAIVGMASEPKPEGTTWRTITLRVDETLKGEHRPTLRFVAWSNHVEKDFDRWANEGRPLLVFLEDSRRVVAQFRQPEYARFPVAPRTGDRARSFLELSPEHARWYTRDLRAMTRPDEILKATRDEIARPPASSMPCEFWLDLPVAGDPIRLSVPMDARLEATAREWARSEDRDFRRLAVAALSPFHSEPNVALLRGLLGDPGTWDQDVYEKGEVAHRLRVHRVAEEASHLLQAWGCEARPVPPREVIPLPARP